jgi:hypothetical protein
VSANWFLKEHNNKGKLWVWNTVLQLLEFTYKVWEHRNLVLLDT